MAIGPIDAAVFGFIILCNIIGLISYLAKRITCTQVTEKDNTALTVAWSATLIGLVLTFTYAICVYFGGLLGGYKKNGQLRYTVIALITISLVGVIGAFACIQIIKDDDSTSTQSATNCITFTDKICKVGYSYVGICIALIVIHLFYFGTALFPIILGLKSTDSVISIQS